MIGIGRTSDTAPSHWTGGFISALSPLSVSQKVSCERPSALPSGQASCPRPRTLPLPPSSQFPPGRVWSGQVRSGMLLGQSLGP